jgi:type I restriction enzyme R subunit
LTGFNAPIEGVMYLDKPLRAHTLFQALTRTNRRWTNPHTGQEKEYGLIVDFVGLGQEIAASMNVRRDGHPDPAQLDIDTLRDEFDAALATALDRFSGIDRTSAGFEQLLEAQRRLTDLAAKDRFAAEFLRVQALWETLWPDTRLKLHKADYRWLAKVYESVQPAVTPDALLWHRLGAKTLALINEHIVRVEVGDAVEDITVDEKAFKMLRELGVDIDGGEESGEHKGKSPEELTREVLDSIEKRIRRRLEESSTPAYRSLAERLDALRKMQIVTAADSIELLKRLLKAAEDLTRLDRETNGPAHESLAEIAEPRAARVNEDSLLPEQRVGALTQVFYEYKPNFTPEIVERVVHEIDAVVQQVRFTGWQTHREGDRKVRAAIRKALAKYGLPATNSLFDRAYAYVAENY